jgi:hypothetical protein
MKIPETSKGKQIVMRPEHVAFELGITMGELADLCESDKWPKPDGNDGRLYGHFQTVAQAMLDRLNGQ